MTATRLWLRRWQADALDTLRARLANGVRDYLAVACPGAGKTTLLLAGAVTGLAADPDRRLVIVTPTRHLKRQWQQAAARFGLALETDWDGHRLPADVHGVVATYQQIAAGPERFREVGHEAVWVLDEIHHATDQAGWGEALTHAAATAAVRLSGTGTAFRSDDAPIAFLPYDADGRVQPDFHYGYGDAVADGIVRPVSFQRLGGRMRWSNRDGVEVEAAFADPLDRHGASERLRTALAPDGGWLESALAAGVAELDRMRRSDPDAGMLVLAMDVDHARAVARRLAPIVGETPPVAVSEDPDSSRRISEFAHGSSKAIVAVRQLSEGVDVPRLRVAVYATNVVTELFFRQAVGRVIRWRDHGPARQDASVILPDDPRLVAFAGQLDEDRVHQLRVDKAADDEEAADDRSAERSDEQMSLFAAVDSQAEDAPVAYSTVGAAPATAGADSLGVEVELPAPPPRAARAGPAPTDTGGLAHRDLRRANHERVKRIVDRTGMTHQAVNTRLNRSVNLQRISEATAATLQRRLREADRWLGRLEAGRR